MLLDSQFHRNTRSEITRGNERIPNAKIKQLQFRGGNLESATSVAAAGR